VKIIQSIPQETDDITSYFDNIVENAKDCGILFILLLRTDRLMDGLACSRAIWPTGIMPVSHKNVN